MKPELPPDLAPRPESLTELYTTFTILALQGFGGVLSVVQRELVDRKRWLGKEQFLELLSLAQVLPGPNVCNVALMVGDRFHGTRGAFVALAGMMSVPLLLVLLATALFAQFAAQPMVSGALHGMGAVAAGLIVGTGLKLAAPLRRNPMGAAACALAVAATFALVALLRWPLVWVLLALGTPACLYAAWRLRRAQEASK